MDADKSTKAIARIGPPAEAAACAFSSGLLEQITEDRAIEQPGCHGAKLAIMGKPRRYLAESQRHQGAP